MSLKSFHVFFILAALGLLGFTAWWSSQRVAAGLDHGSLAIELCSIAAFVAGVPYLGWFLRKARTFK
jgi:hypothetical protein